MCAAVSRSGYYYWRKHDGEAALRDLEALKLVRSVHKRFHGKAGIRTIRMYLEFKHGIVMNLKKISRIKRTYGIETKIRRKNKYNTFNNAVHENEVSPNLVERIFNVSEPDRVYSTDITYLSYYGGKRAFLSATKDLCSREIVHYNISRNIRTDLACDGLGDVFKRLPEAVRSKLIIHSDQGGHYRSKEFRNLLNDYGIKQSMSRRGNCLDNAPIESFFGHMKDEIEFGKCKSFDDVKEMVSKYIRFYNEERYQWTLKKMTPIEYRRHLDT